MLHAAAKETLERAGSSIRDFHPDLRGGTIMLAHTKRIALVGIMLLGGLWALGLAPLRAADGPLRTWTDAKGKSTIKAKFLSLENGVVTLEKEDGTEVEIELKKLSAADQKVATDAAKKKDNDNPFKPKEDDPFKARPRSGKTAAKTGRGKATGGAQNSGAPEAIKTSLKSAKQVKLMPPAGAWKIAVAKPDESGFEPKSAALPPKSNFFEAIKGVAVNLKARKAAVSFLLGEPKPAGTTRLVLCDLATGESSDPAAAPGQMVAAALHDDGQQVVMRREEWGFGNQDRLEVWTIDGNELARTLAWTPYEDAQGGSRDVLWVQFVDADTLATCSHSGSLVLWKFPAIKAECVLNLAIDKMTPVLSPDRRLIAYSTGKEVGLFDVNKKQVVAQQPAPEQLLWPSLAFSPSGKQLACAANNKIYLWDVASGKLERTIPAAGLFTNGPLHFPAEGFVLANDKYLIDVENQLKVWTYEGADVVRSAGGWAICAVSDGEQKAGALVIEQMPHDAASDLLKKALTDPSLFVLKAGTTVRINVAGIRDASQQGRVQSALAKRLETIGCQAGPGGTIELVAAVDGPKEKSVSYRGSGDFKVQEYLSKLQFVYDGKTAWESGVTNVPGVISLKAGENVGSVLKASEKPNYDYFDHVELPKFLQKPAAGQKAGGSLTLGQSRVTTAGLR
jgi:hypothetical protein